MDDIFSGLKKKKSNKDKNFYEPGPGLIVILAQDGRDGNSKDVEAINSTFLEMGDFKVHVVPQEEFLVSKMPDIIQGIWDIIEHRYHTSRNDPGTDYASLSIFVLSHGNTNQHGVEYFEDSQKNKIPFLEFKANFYNGSRPEKFRGRPIFLYMQTCRGEGVNHLLELPLSTDQRVSVGKGDKTRKRKQSEDSLGHDGNSSQEVKRIKSDDDDVREGSSRSSSIRSSGGGSDNSSGGSGSSGGSSSTRSFKTFKKQLDGNQCVPDRDDVFVMKATVEGTKTYKKKKSGSFFIQSICDVLRTKKDIEFYDLCIAVRQSMESKAHSIGMDKGGLVPEVQYTPKKKFRYVKNARKNNDGLDKMYLADLDEQISSQPVEDVVEGQEPVEEQEEMNNQPGQDGFAEQLGQMEIQ